MTVISFNPNAHETGNEESPSPEITMTAKDAFMEIEGDIHSLVLVSRVMLNRANNLKRTADLDEIEEMQILAEITKQRADLLETEYQRLLDAVVAGSAAESP